jgi:outer membrane protein TolC
MFFMKKIITILAFAIGLSANSIVTNNISLTQALEILQSQNLELQAANYDIEAAKAEKKATTGLNWGKLDLTQDVARSNDAGNVFGFKLTSREADFGDFGFSDFLGGISQVMQDSNGNFGTFSTIMSDPAAQEQMLNTQPHDLNYPDAHNFFQTKLKYEVPLFTGFALESYGNVMQSMVKMKHLEKEKLLNEKTYQLRKSYYDMALLESSIKHLQKILDNINTLEHMTKTMIEVGYAKHIDLLEVQAKKGNVERLLAQMKSNEKLLYHFISFLLNTKVTKIMLPKSEIAMPNVTDEDVIANNLDIKRAQTGLVIRKNMLKASEAKYYPTVGAFGEIATADNTFLGDANDHKAYTVGARLTWNLFNGGVDEANIEKAKINKLKTNTQVQLAKKGIILQLAKIRTEIASVDEEIASLEKELQLADAIYANYEGRYREKLVSMSDVIIKQSAQIQKILQLQMAKNKRNEKIFALEKLANGEK